MKNTLKALTGALSASAFLFALPAFADQPGKGWDVFTPGVNERTVVNRSSPVNGTPGKGWDVFNPGAGDIAAQSSGAEVNMYAGMGWDTFRIGAGQPLPR